MKLDSIPYDDLVKLLNFSDPAEFRRRLHVQGFQIPTGKPVQRKLADEIAFRFIGEAVPWYELEMTRRSIDLAAHLNKFCSPESIQSIERWYQKINHDRVQPSGETFLGLVCEGGFLEGIDESEFVLSFKPGINIIIGERGSGKSTVLNLLGLLADSVGVETKGLVRKLLNILYPEVEEGDDEITHIIQRAMDKLRFYGINKYASYSTFEGEVYCFYIDLSEGSYELLRLYTSGWRPIDADKFVKPSILFFEQGEVIRIAEEREKSYYLNSIMDAIYPDLYRQRIRLTKSARDLVSQYENFQLDYLSYQSRMADRFINGRYRELKNMLRELDVGYFNPDHIDMVQDYLDRHNRFFENHPEIHHTGSVYSLLQSGEDALFYLYVGRIRWFLSEDLKQIRSLLSSITNNKTQRIEPEITVSQKSKGEENKGDADATQDLTSAEVVEVLQEIETLKDIVNEDFTKEFEDDKLVTGEATDDEGVTPLPSPDGEEDSSEFARLFLESEKARSRNKPKSKPSWEGWSSSFSEEDRLALFEFMQGLENEGKDPLAEELLKVARHMADFLRTRLRNLRRWIEIFHQRHCVYNKPLYSLVDHYVKLLDQRSSLISEQVAKCQEMTQILKQDESDIRVYTLGAEEALQESQTKIKQLMELSHAYDWIINATPIINLRELKDRVNTYDEITGWLVDDLEEFKALQISPEEHTIIFNPIGIDLRQGNVYRNFQQLSFGQKSGIILKMVLSTTDKKIVVIDQPEDNLDAFSIVNMLSSTLGRIGKQRQLILVTHNSNLVIGLEDSHLFVLKSWGEKGRLNSSGSSLERAIVEEMIDVLEGGKETFDRKLMNYERFIDRVKGMIPDIDFAFVESSYRRRTIDGLSNYLQPIVSDRAAMALARHELKRLDAAQLRMEIRQLRSYMNTVDSNTEPEKNTILYRLDKLADTLDSHIARFLNTIAEIRMMDTNPKPDYVPLYDVLLKLQTEYAERLREGKRDPQFHLDAKLKGIFVWADQNHLRLIFRNLFENALRATELRNIDEILAGKEVHLTELISIHMHTCSEDYVCLIFSDNGRGMPLEIKTKIYKERCSDQLGSDHGLGAVIISKLLGMNFGGIEVIESHTSGDKKGTLQQITLSLKERRA